MVDDPLDAAEIAQLCPDFAIEVHARIDSTQRRARERAMAGAPLPAVVIADAQSAGRGQRGRSWQSPPGAAIYLTAIWPSARALAALSGLSLVVGLAVRSALAAGHIAAQLKWPNDVWVAERKLAGILVEIVPRGAAQIALIGIGLNVRLPPTTVIDQPWIDLAQLQSPPPRNLLIARLLGALSEHLRRFEAHGLTDFSAAWDAADALRDRRIWLQQAGGSVQGLARGIDALGRLRVEIAAELRLVAAGEISVRPV